jgi:ABC-type antimicrobial peptide transport system permease subunit
MNFLGYGFNFEPDYRELIKASDYRNFLKLNNFSVKTGDDKFTYLTSTYNFIHNDTLKDDEIIISITNYNKYFGTNYETLEEIENKEITFAFYSDRTSNGEEIYTRTYKIIELTKSSNIYINIDGAQDLRNYDIIRYGIYLDNHQNIEQVMETATNLDYVVCSVDTVKLSKINKVLEIFGKFFLFIEVFFLLVTIIFLVNIGLSSIKKNKYEIGVLKAIGTLNFDIMRIFIRQSLIVCILIIIVANIGIYIGTYAANAILVKAFEAILNTTFFDLRLINYIPKIVLIDLIYIAGISLLSFIIPQILLFRIKPINIIRAKE